MASTTTSTVSLISSSTFPLKFSFPAKSPSMFNFRANHLPAANAASSGKDHVLFRRGLVFTLSSTLPLLLPFSEYIKAFAAKAVESDISEYELVKEEIRKVVTKGRAAGVLRLVFMMQEPFKLMRIQVV